MARSRFIVSLLVVVGFCAMAGTSFALTKKKPKCAFTGDYSFYFWQPDESEYGVGYFSVDCAGHVLPGGIIDCNDDGTEYEDFIESGGVFLERDGEGTMEIETNSSNGICGTGDNAIELDISVVQGGRRVLFNTNGVEKVQSGTTDNAGFDEVFAGRAAKCFSGDLSGCYDIQIWDYDEPLAGDCTVCLAGGFVTGGTCRCNNDGDEYLSEIVTGGYTLGENCQSSTGFLFFEVVSDAVCGYHKLVNSVDTYAFTVYLDYAAAAGGSELFGACDAFNLFNCAVNGLKQ